MDPKVSFFSPEKRKRKALSLFSPSQKRSKLREAIKQKNLSKLFADDETTKQATQPNTSKMKMKNFRDVLDVINKEEVTLKQPSKKIGQIVGIVFPEEPNFDDDNDSIKSKKAKPEIAVEIAEGVVEEGNLLFSPRKTKRKRFSPIKAEKNFFDSELKFPGLTLSAKKKRTAFKPFHMTPSKKRN